MGKAIVKKMKKVEEDYKSLLVSYKEAKCEIENMNGELTEAYSKIRFLELEVVQANAKIERVSMKKLDEFYLKNIFQTSLGWDIPERAAHQPMSPKK